MEYAPNDVESLVNNVAWRRHSMQPAPPMLMHTTLMFTMLTDDPLLGRRRKHSCCHYTDEIVIYDESKRCRIILTHMDNCDCMYLSRVHPMSYYSFLHGGFECTRTALLHPTDDAPPPPQSRDRRMRCVLHNCTIGNTALVHNHFKIRY